MFFGLGDERGSGVGWVDVEVGEGRWLLWLGWV